MANVSKRDPRTLPMYSASGLMATKEVVSTHIISRVEAPYFDEATAFPPQNFISCHSYTFWTTHFKTFFMRASHCLNIIFTMLGQVISHICIYMNRARCRYNSVIFPMPARMRPYSSPVRASYGVSLRGFKVWYVFCPVDAATYAISCYTEQHYNGTRLGPRHFFL